MAFSPNFDHVFPQFPTSSLSWWDTLAAVPGDKQTGERGHIEDMFLEFLCALLVFGQMDKNCVCVCLLCIEILSKWCFFDLYNLMAKQLPNHTNTRVCVFLRIPIYRSLYLPTVHIIYIYICTYIYMSIYSIRPSLYMLLIGIIWFTVSFLVI